eukprot:5848157-Pyramimonas_sp.AAC.1
MAPPDWSPPACAGAELWRASADGGGARRGPAGGGRGAPAGGVPFAVPARTGAAAAADWPEGARLPPAPIRGGVPGGSALH